MESQPPPPRPLDESLYNLNEEEIEFLVAQTGIADRDELKKHVIAAQTEVYKVIIDVWFGAIQADMVLQRSTHTIAFVRSVSQSAQMKTRYAS